MAGKGQQQQKKKGGKGCPKLRRIAKHKAKYQMQYRRTFRNKLKRIRHYNGEDAARQFEQAGIPQGRMK